MSDDKNKKHGTEPVVSGKKFAGESFPTVTTAEAVAAQQAVDAAHSHPEAMDLNAYFTVCRINDPVKRAMMRAFQPLDPEDKDQQRRLTLPRRATKEAYDAFFKTF